MKKFCFLLFIASAWVFFQACGGVSPIMEKKAPISLQKANQQAVLEENEGLAFVRENTKDIRDYYRAGVQEKARAEKHFQRKSFPEAMKAYESSNEYFDKLLEYLKEDMAEFTLFEGTAILFFPNLLTADNHYKMGLIQREKGNRKAAESNWKRAHSYIQKSLQSERTEWGLSLQNDVSALLPQKN